MTTRWRRGQANKKHSRRAEESATGPRAEAAAEENGVRGDHPLQVLLKVQVVLLRRATFRWPLEHNQNWAAT